MKKPPLGATGEFPRGKLNADDEGAIRLGVTHSQGNVVIEFGTPVKWIGLPPEQAMDLARAIMQHAGEAAKTSRTQ
jgi:hypothetical protein